MNLLIDNGTLIKDTLLANGAVVVLNGKIAYVGKQSELPQEVNGVDINTLTRIDAKGGYISPGLIDCHIHGSAGSDSMEGTEQAIRNIAQYSAQCGATGFLPSTVTASPESTRRVAEVVANYTEDNKGAKVLGVHLEGPYINHVMKGAQYGEEIRQADLEELANLYEILGDKLRLVTLAPEIPNSREAIDWLRERKVTISTGHTNATFEETMAAFDQGVTHVTHTYNGMRGLHHREPGVVGAALVASDVYAELIADGIHVHPGAMRLLFKAKGVDRVILVTDSVQAAGLPDGEYMLGDLQIFVKNGTARLPQGSLAGSTLGMIDAVKNMVSMVDATLPQAIQMASLNPARNLGLVNKGKLAVGYDADIILLSPDLDVQATIVEGITVYQKEDFV